MGTEQEHDIMQTKFVNILRRYPILFSKSKSSENVIRKRDALGLFAIELNANEMIPYSTDQISQKILNIKDSIKYKIGIQIEQNTIFLKSWEKDFYEIALNVEKAHFPILPGLLNF